MCGDLFPAAGFVNEAGFFGRGGASEPKARDAMKEGCVKQARWHFHYRTSGVKGNECIGFISFHTRGILM